jgi:hypothetical protein
MCVSVFSVADMNGMLMSICSVAEQGKVVCQCVQLLI